MKKRLSFLLMTLCLTFLGQVHILHAQSPMTLEIGPHVGVSTTINDINTLRFFSEPDLEYGGLVRYNYDTRWAFRLNYSHCVVKATDSIADWRPERDLNFRSVINDFSLTAEFNFFDFYTGNKAKSISPYIFGGFSAFTYKTSPMVTAEQMSQLIGTTNAESMKQFNELWKTSLGSGYSFSIPFGIGCKFSLSEHLCASIEWWMHYTLTDNIDGISDPYPYTDNHSILVGYQKVDPSTGNLCFDNNGQPVMSYDIINGELSALDPQYITSYDLTDRTGNYYGGQQRGNSQSMDWFGHVTLSLTWKIPLPGGTACRVMKY